MKDKLINILVFMTIILVFITAYGRARGDYESLTEKRLHIKLLRLQLKAMELLIPVNIS